MTQPSSRRKALRRGPDVNPQPHGPQAHTGDPMSKTQFDKVILSLGGSEFIVPRDAAMAVFELFVGHDVYKVQTWYTNNYKNNKPMAVALEPEYLPTIRTLGPVQFATMRANAEAKEEHDRAEQAKKEANA